MCVPLCSDLTFPLISTSGLHRTNPDYNIIIRTAPPRVECWNVQSPKYSALYERSAMPIECDWREAYHWYVEIIPHITVWGGIACYDMVVHKMLPETMAKSLMEALRVAEQHVPSVS